MSISEPSNGRLRLIALTRGIAVTAGMALALTVVAVLVINQFAFSNGSVIGARVFLFLGLAFAIAAALVIPVIRLNRRNAARRAEAQYPQFEERLLTFTERIENNPGDPFLSLLADDTLRVAQQAEPKSVVKSAWIYSFSSAAVAAALVLIWLGTTPGFMGYGTSLLWAGLPKGVTKPFYSILVDPGNRTVRKRSDQLDHRAPHRLHRAQGALLRQVRERLAMGAGRNGHRTGRHRLPVPDRRRAGEPRILCRGRRREEQHLQAERDRSAGRQENSRHLPLPGVAGLEG